MDYHFVFASAGLIPDGSQPHWHEADGTPLWVARSPGATDPFFLNSIQPGKVLNNGVHPGKIRFAFGAAASCQFIRGIQD